jgi:hypothetical protein
MGNLDDDLLARFAALRGATGGGSPAAEPPVQAGSASTTPNDFGDADVSDQIPLRAACTRSLTWSRSRIQVEAYLAAFEASTGDDDGEDAALAYLSVPSAPTGVPLEQEAALLLKQTSGLVEPQQDLVDGHGFSEANARGADENEGDDDDAAEDSHLDERVVLQQALDQAAVEAAHEPIRAGINWSPSDDMTAQPNAHAAPRSLAASSDLSSVLAALSTPSVLVDLPEPFDSAAEDPAYARLMGLRPSAEPPKDKTAAAKAAGPQGAAPKPLDIAGWRAARDDAVESWCCASPSVHSSEPCSTLSRLLTPFVGPLLLVRRPIARSHLLVRCRAPLPRLRRRSLLPSLLPRGPRGRVGRRDAAPSAAQVRLERRRQGGYEVMTCPHSCACLG